MNVGCREVSKAIMKVQQKSLAWVIADSCKGNCEFRYIAIYGMMVAHRRIELLFQE